MNEYTPFKLQGSSNMLFYGIARYSSTAGYPLKEKPYFTEKKSNFEPKFFFGEGVQIKDEICKQKWCSK